MGDHCAAFVSFGMATGDIVPAAMAVLRLLGAAMAEHLPSKDQLKQANELLDALMDFAYEQGFHECGYNPAKMLNDELDRLQRENDTCGLQCSATMQSLMRDCNDKDITIERLRAEVKEGDDLVNSEWFARVTYKQQLRAAEARIDALMLEYCPDEMTQEQRDNWAANQRAAQPPGDG